MVPLSQLQFWLGGYDPDIAWMTAPAESASCGGPTTDFLHAGEGVFEETAPRVLRQTVQVVSEVGSLARRGIELTQPLTAITHPQTMSKAVEARK